MKNLRRIIAPAISLLVLGLSIIYLTERLKFFLGLENAGWLYLIISISPFLMFSGLFSFSNSTSPSGSLVYKISAFTISFILYFLLSVILVDLIGLFIDIPSGLMGILSAVIALIAITGGFLNSYRTGTTCHRIEISGLKKKLRIAHLSDIHIGHFRGRKFLDRIVDKSILKEPDLVVITGDLFDGRVRLSKDELKPLAKFKVPVLFVNGNHDVYSGLDDVFRVVDKAGVRILNNEVLEFNGLQIAGLNHMRADENTSGMHAAHGPVMKDILPGLNIDKNKPSLLLHHSPDGIEYANREGIDLYLSGHTHGGQQFPVTLINQALFRFNKGLHNYNGTKILVSRGLGTFGPPVRIGTNSEIVIIDLVPS
jgi:predicted MPP superfamily phosphohydrolase